MYLAPDLLFFRVEGTNGTIGNSMSSPVITAFERKSLLVGDGTETFIVGADHIDIGCLQEVFAFERVIAVFD